MENKRNTIQQRLVYNAVKELNGHVTAEQVFEYVVKKYPSVGKATVYRNLNKMAETGELIHIGNFNGSGHYDHNCREHCHFICEGCNRIFDIDENFSDIADRAKAAGFYITDYSISFKGLCCDCKVKS